MLTSLDNEAFYSHVLTIKYDGKSEKAILRDLQRHPYKPAILHVDLQRITEDQEIRVVVPFHFLGENVTPGVKLQGGVISHMITEAEVTCLPAKLPEFIEIDLSHLHINEAVRLSEVRLPEGVRFVELLHGLERDSVVANVHPVRGGGIDELEEGAEEEAEGMSPEG